MNEQDNLSEHDIETLQRVEALLASPQPSANGATEVSVLLAKTIPNADPTFKSQLEAQLLAKLDAKRVQKPQEAHASVAGSARPATLLKRAPIASRIPFNQAAGRLGSVLVGAAMAAALILALAFLLQSRRDTPNIAYDGTATANALATLTASGSNLMPDYPTIIRTSLLPVSFIAWSPDGRSSTSAMAWSGDGRTLASAAPDGKVTFWNAATGEKLREIDTSSTGSLRGIEWSPDGMILSTYSDNPSSGWGFVDLWDATTGEKLHSFTEQQGRITSMDWSPDNSLLAWTDGWNIRLWDKATESTLPKPQPTWPAPIIDPGIEPNLTTNLDWSSDGARLATSQSNIVKIWDPRSGQELAVLNQSGPVSRIDWSHDGSRLAVLVAGDPTQVGGQSSALVLWDTASNRQIDTPVIEGTVTSIAWLPRGLVLALSVVDDRTAIDHVSRYDVTTGQLVRITDGIATELAWSPDNKTLAIANSLDGTITLLDAFAELQPSPTPAGKSSPTMEAIPGSPSPTAGPPVFHDCWDGWDVSVGPNTAIAGAKSGSAISLGDVVAVDYSDVWAVGSTRDSISLATTLTAHWDGTKWSVVPSPNKSEEFGYQALHAVTALSSTDVWAVGDYTSSNAAPHETLIQHWDGTKWSIVRSPSLGSSNSLTAIAAASPNDIWAVGYTSNNNGPIATLTLHWDGQNWRVVPSPAVGTASGLQSVVAISANDAWAVGWSQGDGTGDASSINVGMPLTMHWDGKTWNVVTVPGVENAQLTGVSASPIGDLWAVGYKTNSNGTEPLVLHWDEIRWNVVPTPKVKSNDSIYNIKVITGEDIWVVGAQAMHWDGRTWTVQSGAGWPDVILTGMTVHWRTDIWAVGTLGSNPQQPVVLHRSTSYPCARQTPSVGQPEATFALLHTPTNSVPSTGRTPSLPAPVGTEVVPPVVPVAVPARGCDPHWDIIDILGTGSDERLGIGNLTAISENDIWAVGSRGSSAPDSYASQTLAMHWNGASWTTIPTPNKGYGINSLVGMTALASNDVWAIGSYAERPDSPYETFMLHWDGKGWAIPPSPTPATFSLLTGIDAISTDDIWAMGWSRGDVAGDPSSINMSMPLTMHWDGKGWSIINTPRIGKISSGFSAVVAVAADDVWAVGSYRDIRPTQEAPVPGSALAMHWNGRAWTIVPIPDSSVTELTGITATGPTEVWAIGTRQTGQPNSWTLELAVLRWDGSKWSTVPIPKLEMLNSRGKIVAASTDDIWAFGQRTLHWDGTRWTRVFEPQIEVTDWTGKQVVDVHIYEGAVTPSGTVWALGSYMWSNKPIQIMTRYNNSPCSSPAPGTPRP